MNMTNVTALTIPEGPVKEMRAADGITLWQQSGKEPEINENLIIHSAALRAASVVSGKVATLTVRASFEAETITVTAADGTIPEPTRNVCQYDTAENVARFTFIWKVFGSRGDVFEYTIRVYDAEGRASVNTETVTVTIK